MLDVVDFYGIRVATLPSSGLAVGSIASSSANLWLIAFFHESLVEHVVDFNCSLLQSVDGRRVSSVSYKLVLNVVLKASIVHGP